MGKQGLGPTRLVELIRSLQNQEALKMCVLNEKNVFLVKKIHLAKKTVTKIACLSLCWELGIKKKKKSLT